MFNPALENTFRSFTLSHWIPVLIIFGISYLIIHHQEWLRRPNIIKKMRYLLASVIIFQEILLNLYRILNGTWSLAESLPFHLCGLAVLSTAYVLITENKKYFYATFFVMLIGAVMALLTPSVEGNMGFPHFRYFQFFVSHGLIVINFVFILFVMNYHKDMTYRHLIYNFFSLIGFALFNLIINLLFGGNYMFLMAKPGPNTAFDLFGEHPWYLIHIFIFGIPVFFHLFYLPFFIRNLRAKLKFKSI
jgi:hypothetical integral membrane protein (TIGR02206 family)